MAVIDDVFLAVDKLDPAAISSSSKDRKEKEEKIQFMQVLAQREQRGRCRLTSFLKIAPKELNQQIPVPLNLYTNSPSPENMALLNP